MPLDLVPVIRFVVFRVMQYQPDFKTRVGPSRTNVITGTQRDSFIVPRMLITIENSPDLVVLLVQVSVPA